MIRLRVTRGTSASPAPRKRAAVPQPSHLLENDITPRDEAIYVPAVTPNFATDVYAGAWKRPLPKGVAAGDLNFLDPSNTFFRISHVLTSAGQGLRKEKKPCIITERARKNTLVIADSGGYQIASGRLVINGDQDRRKILEWQEARADIAITLDVPTAPLLRKVPYKYSTPRECLTATVDHLRCFRKYRKSNIIFLNVLQGNNPRDADIWYNTVKQEFEGEGFAFAGPMRNDIYQMIRRLLQMQEDGFLARIKWIHVLGTNQLESAVLLSAVQNAINRYVTPHLRISYDTSSPFRNLRWNKAFSIPTFESKGMTMPTRDAPDGPEFVDKDVPWPWRSPLGDRMVMSDFCIEPKGEASRYRDTQSNWYLAHHNLSALCWAINQANRIFRAESLNHRHTIAVSVGEAAEAIDRIFKRQSRFDLAKARPIFDRLRNVKAYDRADEERDLPDGDVE